VERAYDVVVAGAGLAGLRAAIAAAEGGARVLLVSKAEPGGSTSAAAWGGLSGAVGGTSVEDYVRTLEDKGEGLGEPSLRRAMAEDTAFRLEELPRFGVEIDSGRGHVLVNHPPFSLPVTSTLMALLAYAKGLGVEAAFGHAVTGLEMSSGRVAGAVVRGEGRREVVGAGAVVIAGGGFSGLMPHNDNQGRNLGDALAVALVAGAKAVDMEFMSFMPVGLADPRWRQDSIYARPIVLAGKWATPKGEPLEPKQAEEYFRQQARIIDRDDERYDLTCDLSGVPKDVWDDDLAEHAQAFFGNEPRPKSVRVAPLAHYTMGGIAIDEQARTAVAGLYAAGECTGGLFGADRPGGGALTDCVVFGARAGTAAARWAGEQRGGGHGGTVELKAVAPEAAAQMVAEAGWAAWNFGGMYKHAEGMKVGLAWLESVAAEMAAKPVVEEDGSCEAAGALTAAWLHLRASLLRKETRGNHRRLDFPEADEQMSGTSLRFGIEDGPPMEAVARFD
jgi:succinate dehydrogenase/fumarate reductase flavoprotein subunit